MPKEEMSLEAQKQYALNKMRDKSYSPRISYERIDYLLALSANFLIQDCQLPLSRKQEFIDRAKGLFKKGTTEREFEAKVNLLYLEEFMQ